MKRTWPPATRLDGLILPSDHLFWETHYPPNGWGCKCRVVGVRSEEAARRLGGDPDKPLPKWWNEIDAKSGEPAGIDNGWGYMPGNSVLDIVRRMAAKTVQWEYTLAKAFMQSVPETVRDRLAVSFRDLPEVGEDVRRYADRIIQVRTHLDIPQYKTMGLVTRKDAALIEQLTGTDVDGFDWALDRYAPAHVHSRHGNDAAERDRGQRAVVSADWTALPSMLNAPDKIYSDKREIVVEKRVNGEKYKLIFAVFGGRRMVVLKSMRIYP